MEIPVTIDHLSEESLERYVQGRLSVAEAAMVSEHLFECDACSERYDKEVDLLTGVRAAGPSVMVQPERTSWWQMAAWPSPVWAGAAALILLLAIFPRLTPTGSPVVAELNALRSDMSVRAPANRPIGLRLDATGVEGAQKVRVEIADSTGRAVRSVVAEMTNGRWEATVDRGLSPGRYWVRVYLMAGGDAVREYSLTLE